MSLRQPTEEQLPHQPTKEQFPHPDKCKLDFTDEEKKRWDIEDCNFEKVPPLPTIRHQSSWKKREYLMEKEECNVKCKNQYYQYNKDGVKMDSDTKDVVCGRGELKKPKDLICKAPYVAPDDDGAFIFPPFRTQK